MVVLEGAMVMLVGVVSREVSQQFEVMPRVACRGSIWQPRDPTT